MLLCIINIVIDDRFDHKLLLRLIAFNYTAVKKDNSTVAVIYLLIAFYISITERLVYNYTETTFNADSYIGLDIFNSFLLCKKKNKTNVIFILDILQMQNHADNQ